MQETGDRDTIETKGYRGCVVRRKGVGHIGRHVGYLEWFPHFIRPLFPAFIPFVDSLR